MARPADDLVRRYGPERVVAALAPILTEERKARIERVLDRRLTSLTVVLEDLYDPHNGAACIRSVEGFGLSDLHVIERVHRFERTSGITIGAEKWIDLHRHGDVAAAAEALRGAGFSLCATRPGAELTAADLDPGRRWAVLFGSERDGLSSSALEAADTHIAVPMYGFTRSFNLSVSVALVVRELAERRRRALGAMGDLPDDRRDLLRARWYALKVRGAGDVVRRFVSD